MKLLKLLISIDLTIIFPSFAHLWCHEPNAGHIAGLAGSRAVGQEAQRWACGGTQMAEFGCRMPRVGCPTVEEWGDHLKTWGCRSCSQEICDIQQTWDFTSITWDLRDQGGFLIHTQVFLSVNAGYPIFCTYQSPLGSSISS
jgi:hypothetical protein